MMDQGQRAQLRPYIFIRDEFFYVIDLIDDADAAENAHHNPGTMKVINLLTDKVVWEKGKTQ